MKTKMKYRNPLTVLVLSIVTLGIYDLYWLVKTKTVLNNTTRIHTPTIWLLFSPIGLLVIIVALYVFSAPQPLVTHTTTTYGNMVTSSSTNSGFPLFLLFLEFLAIVIIIPVTFYWFFQFSKAINEFTNGELNTGVSFLLLWLLHFIGVIIVQDKFNDMIQAGLASGNVPPTPNPKPAGMTPFQAAQLTQPVIPYQAPVPTSPQAVPISRTQAPGAQHYHTKSVHHKHKNNDQKPGI